MKTRQIVIVVAVLSAAVFAVGCQTAPQAAPASDPIVAGFQKTFESTAADAVDQICGQRGFMSHDMRPRTGGKIVGRARTVILRATTPELATPALSTKDSVEVLDSSKPGEVAVIVVEDGLDVAGLGGLMATTAKVRGMAGAVIDGGLRDVLEVQRLGLPVYSRSVIPSSSVGRWATAGRDVPVKCAGIMVRPGDIIVAGEDGVTVVPKEKEAEVLKRALEIDERESKMVPMIKQFKSLAKAIAAYNRI